MKTKQDFLNAYLPDEFYASEGFAGINIISDYGIHLKIENQDLSRLSTQIDNMSIRSVEHYAFFNIEGILAFYFTLLRHYPQDKEDNQ